MAADRTPNELADALERSQNSYIAMMADGHRSIIVRSKDDELAECYQLMAEAAVLLREQAEQLDTLRNAIAEHRESALCNGSMFVADRERDLWDALDALATAGGGVPETKENNDG